MHVKRVLAIVFSNSFTYCHIVSKYFGKKHMKSTFTYTCLGHSNVIFILYVIYRYACLPFISFYTCTIYMEEDLRISYCFHLSYLKI